MHIACLGGPAVGGTNPARGGEDDVAIGQVATFEVSDANTGGQLTHLAGGPVHFIEVVVVNVRVLLPCEENSRAIIRHINVAEYAVFVMK